MQTFVIRHYVTDDGRDVFLEWLRRVRDHVAKAQIVRRVNRLELGNFGDHKFCRDERKLRMKDRAHDESMAELFREDPAFATTYLNKVLGEGDQADLLIALRQLAQAFGGVPAIAEQAHLNVTQLYRTLSAQGNPELRSLTAVLKAMGLRLAVQPIRRA